MPAIPNESTKSPDIALTGVIFELNIFVVNFEAASEINGTMRMYFSNADSISEAPPNPDTNMIAPFCIRKHAMPIAIPTTTLIARTMIVCFASKFFAKEALFMALYMILVTIAATTKINAFL